MTTYEENINLLPNELQYEIIDKLSLDELRTIFMSIENPDVRAYASRRGRILMAPKGLLGYNLDTAQKAADNYSFVHVCRNNRPCGRRTIGGINRVYNIPKFSRDIFLMDLRITGTPEDVIEALYIAGYNKEEIDLAISDALTADNYENDPRYVEELKEFRQR